MASLIALSIKGSDGTYKKFTISINDKSDKFGQNVAMYKEQTKEEREQVKKKEYIGNGKVFWTDGKIVKADKREDVPSGEPDETQGLPF